MFSRKSFSATSFLDKSFAFPKLPVEEVVQTTGQSRPASGGGGGRDSGTGYVYTEHGWVKATKVVRHSIVKPGGYAVPFAFAVGTTRYRRLRTLAGQAIPTSFAVGATKQAAATKPVASAYAVSSASIVVRSMGSQRFVGSVETLSMDEVLAILDLMDSES